MVGRVTALDATREEGSAALGPFPARGAVAASLWVVAVVLGYLWAGDFRAHTLLYLPALTRAEVGPTAAAELRGAGDLARLLVAGAVPPLAFTALGAWWMRRWFPDPTGAERLGLAYLLGSGFASLVILGSRLIDVAAPMSALAVLAASLPFARPRRAGPAPATAPPPIAARAADALSVALGVGVLAAALAPETGWDALVYHFPMVEAWSSGPIRSLPSLLDAEFRSGADLLFLPAIAFGQPDAVAAVSAGFAFSLAALVRAEARRRASTTAGAWAGLLTLSAPLVLEHAPVGYVDLAVGGWGFGALLFADRWNRTGDPRALVVSAVLVAFAANGKLHAAVLAPAVLALVLCGGRRPAASRWGVCVAVSAGLMLPWFAKTAVTAGNPLFPLLGDWLGYGPTDAAFLASRRQALALDFPVARDLRGLASYLGAITFSREAFVGGMLGPLPLALGLLAWRRPSPPTLALGLVLAVLLVLQFVYAPALRFGLAILAFGAVAAAVGGQRLASSGGVGRCTVVLVSAGLVGFHLTTAVGAYAPRWRALVAPAPYERAVWPTQHALRRAVARAEPVVGIRMGAVSWMDRPVYSLHWERNGELFFDRRTSPEAARAVLDRRGVRSLVWPVATPLPDGPSVRHPIIDAWLREGRARIRQSDENFAAGSGRVWVTVDLD